MGERGRKDRGQGEEAGNTCGDRREGGRRWEAKDVNTQITLSTMI